MTVSDRQRVQVEEELETKYEVLDVLGSGGMGRVLRARHRQLKRLVAIKLLHHDLKSDESVTRFLREARAAAQIRSVHVAHVMDAGLLRSGQPYIVMEYLQGQNLASLVASRGRMAVEQAVGFTLQALDALAEAHSMQIVHRDLKPANLFATRVIGGDTAIKVVDFGLAKSGTLDTLDPGVTERGAVLGTPSYMSPEQFVDAQDVDARTDIWGIGATLFELLTGAPPFRGTNLPQIYTAVMHKPIAQIRSAVPDLPEGLERVVATCLTRDRESRYANVAELAEALRPYASDAMRDRVDRIRRVVDGVHESADLGDQVADFAESAEQSGPQPAVISSRVARAGNEGRPISVASRFLTRRRYSLLVALVGTLTGGWFWWSAVQRLPPSAARPAAAQAMSTETEKPVPPLPAAAAEELTQHTAVEPPPATVPVAPPTANKVRRAKTSKSTLAKSSDTSIYQQYP